MYNRMLQCVYYVHFKVMHVIPNTEYTESKYEKERKRESRMCILLGPFDYIVYYSKLFGYNVQRYAIATIEYHQRSHKKCNSNACEQYNRNNAVLHWNGHAFEHSIPSETLSAIWQTRIFALIRAETVFVIDKKKMSHISKC